LERRGVTNLQQIENLIEIARQLELVADLLPEETLEWNEEKEDYEVNRAPLTDYELAAVGEVQDLVGQLFDMLFETKVAMVGADLRAAS
jgi:hypothetical protein